MFANLLNRGKDAVAKFAKDPNLLEALCAGCTLVASADGEFSDAEFNASLDHIRSNAMVQQAGFTASDIGRVMDKMSERAKRGRSGRAELYQELEDISSKPELADAAVFIILDVADHGGIDDKERTVLTEIGKRLCKSEMMKKELASA